ncbi:hypothetical protein C8R45DRAFT_928730 [Mycena sanguinolenta]|nr:hypothetical protein C8R45DRAFT_928730 [Mycena sanguinolenta]
MHHRAWWFFLCCDLALSLRLPRTKAAAPFPFPSHSSLLISASFQMPADRWLVDFDNRRWFHSSADSRGTLFHFSMLFLHCYELDFISPSMFEPNTRTGRETAVFGDGRGYQAVNG